MAVISDPVGNFTSGWCELESGLITCAMRPAMPRDRIFTIAFGPRLPKGTKLLVKFRVHDRRPLLCRVRDPLDVVALRFAIGSRRYPSSVTALPDLLDRKQHVDLEKRGLERWLVGAVIVVARGVSALGLANVFGQKVETKSATAAAADLEVEAPSAVRSGFDLPGPSSPLRRTSRLDEPRLVLDSGWFDGFTINTMSPDTKEWVMRDGRNVLSYDPLPAGTGPRRPPAVPGQPHDVRQPRPGRRTHGRKTRRSSRSRHETTVFP